MLTKIGSAVEIAASAITGKVASPGELHTITPQTVRRPYESCHPDFDVSPLQLALVEGLNLPVKH
jgi:hypothetical protein